MKPVHRLRTRSLSVLAVVALAVVAVPVGLATQAQAASTASSRTASLAAAIDCTGWHTMEVGQSPGRFVRPRSDGQNASLYGTGTASQYWNNQFMLCPFWIQTTVYYGMYFNLGGRFARVNPTTRDVVVSSSAIEDVWNLVRICDYDGNFQHFSSLGAGGFIGPVSPAGQYAATRTNLNGTHLVKIRPLPPFLDC